MATLYDTWDLTTQPEFNRDGTMRKDIRDRLIAEGDEATVLHLEYRNQRQIAKREELDLGVFCINPRKEGLSVFIAES
jgi:hypothetical protein